jgi:outer membrane lipoprotein SlyB
MEPDMRSSLSRVVVAVVVATSAVLGCATTETTSTTWVATSGAWTRPGRVESIREITQRVEGNPAGGALLGALIGGILFHGRGPATLFGAATGAAIGAAASSGTAETHSLQVLVRFDDGDYGMFVFGGASPFRPGDPVVLTPQGLMRR